MLPGAPGIATKNKKLLGTPGPTTRSKKLLGAKTLPGAPGIDRGDSLRPLSAKAASRDSTVRRARARIAVRLRVRRPCCSFFSCFDGFLLVVLLRDITKRLG